MAMTKSFRISARKPFCPHKLTLNRTFPPNPNCSVFKVTRQERFSVKIGENVAINAVVYLLTM